MQCTLCKCALQGHNILRCNLQVYAEREKESEGEREREGERKRERKKTYTLLKLTRSQLEAQ